MLVSMVDFSAMPFTQRFLEMTTSHINDGICGIPDFMAGKRTSLSLVKLIMDSLLGIQLQLIPLCEIQE